MKIKAVTRLQLTAETYDEYTHRLIEDFKLKQIGAGSYSRVFQHPTIKNVVVKLVKRDDRYIEFAKLSLANPKNPWLPQIAAIKSLNLKDQKNAHLIFMEKLKPISSKVCSKVALDLANTYGLTPVMDPTSPWFSEASSGWFSKSDWAKLATQSKDPALAKFASFAVKNYQYLDLYRANLMARGKQIVFADPVA